MTSPLTTSLVETALEMLNIPACSDIQYLQSYLPVRGRSQPQTSLDKAIEALP